MAEWKLALCVISGDEKALTAAPGIGKKLAQRILLELKDKMGSTAELDFSGGSAPVQVTPTNEQNLSIAYKGLQELGYAPAEIAKALKPGAIYLFHTTTDNDHCLWNLCKIKNFSVGECKSGFERICKSVNGRNSSGGAGSNDQLLAGVCIACSSYSKALGILAGGGSDGRSSAACGACGASRRGVSAVCGV